MADAIMQKWVCQDWSCAQVYDGTERFCPHCGHVSVPQKRVRRAGIVLIACGIFLIGMMATISWFLVPLMLAAGDDVNGSRFTGTQSDVTVILGLFGLLILFGFGSLFAGYFQWRHGRQNWKVVGIMLALVSVIFVIGWLVQGGFLLSQS